MTGMRLRIPVLRFLLETSVPGLRICSITLAILLTGSSAMTQLVDYRAKANFLVAFPNFVEWPAGAFSSDNAPLAICVFGDFSFGTSLAEAGRAASVQGRRVEVRWTRKEQDLRSCQIVFVSHSEAGHYAKILGPLQGTSILTVGETDDFLSSGGAIRFVVLQDRLQFEINLQAAEAAHLRISSTMLALAHQVVKGETAKVTLASHSDAQPN